MCKNSVTSERRYIFQISNVIFNPNHSVSSFQTTDSADFLATRPHTAAVIPGKPAGNPLQFVRVGPADLGSRAREQLRRAELAKRTDPARIERQEDWQSVSVVSELEINVPSVDQNGWNSACCKSQDQADLIDGRNNDDYLL